MSTLQPLASWRRCLTVICHLLIPCQPVTTRHRVHPNWYLASLWPLDGCKVDKWLLPDVQPLFKYLYNFYSTGENRGCFCTQEFPMIDDSVLLNSKAHNTHHPVDAQPMRRAVCYPKHLSFLNQLFCAALQLTSSAWTAGSKVFLLGHLWCKCDIPVGFLQAGSVVSRFFKCAKLEQRRWHMLTNWTPHTQDMPLTPRDPSAVHKFQVAVLRNWQHGCYTALSTGSQMPETCSCLTPHLKVPSKTKQYI